MGEERLMEDTLKTTSVGILSATTISLGILPDLVAVIGGILTIIYFIIKIKKEI